MGLEPTRIRFYRTKSLTKLGLLYTPNFKRLSGLRIIERRAKFALEQVKVIETSSVEWQSTVLAVVLHLHKVAA